MFCLQVIVTLISILGMEALETAIAYWEDALAAYRPPPGDILALTVRIGIKMFYFILNSIFKKITSDDFKCDTLRMNDFLNIFFCPVALL